MMHYIAKQCENSEKSISMTIRALVQLQDEVGFAYRARGRLDQYLAFGDNYKGVTHGNRKFGVKEKERRRARGMKAQQKIVHIYCSCLYY